MSYLGETLQVDSCVVMNKTTDKTYGFVEFSTIKEAEAQGLSLSLSLSLSLYFVFFLFLYLWELTKPTRQLF